MLRAVVPNFINMWETMDSPVPVYRLSSVRVEMLWHKVYTVFSPKALFYAYFLLFLPVDTQNFHTRQMPIVNGSVTVLQPKLWSRNSIITHLYVPCIHAFMLWGGTASHLPVLSTGRRHVSYFRTSAKLRKATISFMSFWPSAWNNSAPTRRIFMKIYIWVFFENLSRKFKSH